MFKKSLISIFIVFSLLFSFGIDNAAGESSPPSVNCYGLPGCYDKIKDSPGAASIAKNHGIDKVSNLIGNLIQYVAVFAVLALVLSGVMYLVSGGEEEKVKKAKSWIIWSLIGVLLSVSAWGIINVLNNITIK